MIKKENFYKTFVKDLNENVLDRENFDLITELNNLFRLEDRFKKNLMKTKSGNKMFERFMKHVIEVDGSILSGSNYFRERSKDYFAKIAKCFHKQDSSNLSKYKMNYKFMEWAIKNPHIPSKKELTTIYTDATKVRKRIVEQNLPLVINRAKVFQVKAKKAEIDYLDLISIATEGFLIAVDKFSPPASEKFKSVAIGFMTWKMIEGCSDTLLKMSAKEKRVLYRANIAIYRMGLTDKKQILDFIKESFPDVKIRELEEIISSTTGIADVNSIKSTHEISVSNIEHDALSVNLSSTVNKAIEALPILESKVIKMKGGDYE